MWNNQHMTIARKSVSYRWWYEAGVKCTKDVISKGGNFTSLNVFQRAFGITKTSYST